MHETSESKRSVVLLSGGLDSATALAVAKSLGYETHALTFSYGQRHVVEVDSAFAVARAIGVHGHTVVAIDPIILGGSALAASGVVPKDRDIDKIGDGIPDTYVPARNTVFLAFALSHAETIGAADIFIGVNYVDYSGYPDCRPGFIRAFQQLANLATKEAVEGRVRFAIRTPLSCLSKAEIIRLGLELGVDYSLTHSCYDPDLSGSACGRCDSCKLRLHGFHEAGLADPAPYQKGTL